MKKFKYLKISKTKKLRYLVNYYKKTIYNFYLALCPILTGKSLLHLKSMQKNKLGFLQLNILDTENHLEEFNSGNISKWSNVKRSIKKIVKKIILF